MPEMHSPTGPTVRRTSRAKHGSFTEKEKDKSRPPTGSYTRTRRASVDSAFLGLGTTRTPHSTTWSRERSSLSDTTEKRNPSSSGVVSSERKQTGSKDGSQPPKPILKSGPGSYTLSSTNSLDDLSTSPPSDSGSAPPVPETSFRCCYRLPVEIRPTIRKTVSFKEDSRHASIRRQCEEVPVDRGLMRTRVTTGSRRYSSPQPVIHTRLDIVGSPRSQAAQVVEFG
jgi:hypothetical protein